MVIIIVLYFHQFDLKYTLYTLYLCELNFRDVLNWIIDIFDIFHLIFS